MVPFVGSCPQLQELRLARSDLTAELMECLMTKCPTLQLLDLSLHNGQDINTLFLLLRSCVQLEELVLRDLRLCNVTAVFFVSFPHIKRLTFRGRNRHHHQDKEIFMDLLDHCPWLEYLCVHGFTFSRRDGKLELPRYGLDYYITSVKLTRILNHWNSLQVFSWKARLTVDIAILLADNFSETVRSLVLCPYDFVLKIFLQRCGGLLSSIATLGYPQ